MRPEIQAYFRSVAEQHRVVEYVRFHSVVEKAEWDDDAKVWVVTVLNLKTKQQTVRRVRTQAVRNTWCRDIQGQDVPFCSVGS
jgi:cation diffusion facilitator CzcD-associated flavoprotein CzcO